MYDEVAVFTMPISEIRPLHTTVVQVLTTILGRLAQLALL